MNSEIEKLAAELEPDAVVERFVAVLPPGVMGKLLAETGIDTLAAKEAVDNFFKLAELIGRVGSCDPLTALREIAEVDQLPRTPVNQKRSAVTIPVESRYPASAQENNVKPRGQRVRVVMPHGAGQYLLEELRNPKYPERLGKTRFPGGEIEDGETPEQAAVRELREELGVTIDPKAFKRLGVLPHHEFDCDEHYLQLDNHGVQPGTFDNAVGGDARVHLISGAPHGDSYYGPDVSKLLEGTSPTGPAQAGGAGLLAIKKIAAGPLVHVAGASGSGKSTVLNRLAAARPDAVVKDIDEIDYDAKNALGYPVELHTYTPDMHAALAAKKKEMSDAFVAAQGSRPVVLGGVANDESGYDTAAVHKLMLSTGPLLSTLRAYRRDFGTEWGNPLWKFPKHYLDNRKLYRDLEATGYEKIDPAVAAQRLQTLIDSRKSAAFDVPGVGVRHATIAAAGGADTMSALRLAKQHSDAFRYNQKLAILREMITTSPSDWYIDSELNNTWGISHSSGWKFHLPKSSISDLNIRTAIKPRTPSIPTDLYTL